MPMNDRFSNDDYVSMTMEFRCNLKCVHCMIEGTMDRLAPESMASFERVLDTNRAERRWRGLILTGSEITLRKDLPELAKRAKASGFEHVRIQTHGMHLARPGYSDRLVDAGIDEFFVSVAGSDEATHDEITQIPGAFERMLRGLEYLDRYDHVSLLTNTVVTRLSYRLLPKLVHRLAHLSQLKQMEFWVYWPMREDDEKDLIAPHADVLPFLQDAADQAQGLGRSVAIKNFPQCLLGSARDLLDNDQPELHIDESFWREFHRNGFHRCVYRNECASQQCLGLNEAYTKKFGWEEDRLSPIPLSSDVKRPAAPVLDSRGDRRQLER